MATFIEDHDADIEALADAFTYRNVTKGKVSSWLNQFEAQHQPIALKLLQNIRFYDLATIVSSCKALCQVARVQCGQNLNHVVFMGLGQAGKSGDMMLYRFRHSNGMHTQLYAHKFKHSSEISSLDPSFTGHLVFLDDFIGSGSQAAASLSDVISIAPTQAKILLLVLVAYQSAINEICKEIDCNVFPVEILDESEKLFSNTSQVFTPAEQTILKGYCSQTGSEYPYGYKDVGSLVVFADGVPNNTPSILIHGSNTWHPLFPRI